jgi:hypothetical protein
MTVMPSERETSATVSATSGAVNTAYGSTYMTGFVDNIYVAISSQATTSCIVKITSSSTTNVIFTVVNPSTLGLYYIPRAKPYVGGTTALTAVHPTSQAVPISLFQERMKVSVVSTTATLAQTATVRMRINPLY